MSRPRTPTNILKLKGADKKNPRRFKDRENEPENINEIGMPPIHLSKMEKAAFNEIVNLSIDGVLGGSDTIAVEMAATLLIKCRGQFKVNGETLLASAAEQGQFFKYLSQFGMTPADRSKISITKKVEYSEWDDL